MNIGIIDYGAGNLRSVANAVRHLGSAPSLVTHPRELAGLDRLIFPGVGSFGDCVENLLRLDLWGAVGDWIAADRPYLGICLGYQVLFEGSDETPGVSGFAALRGRCVSFDPTRLKVPHMGWNTVEPTDPSDLIWAGLPEHPYFYFVHSYYPQPEDAGNVAAWSTYGDPFAAAVRRGNLFATQFHPERSQDNGLTLLGNFLGRTITEPSPGAMQ